VIEPATFDKFLGGLRLQLNILGQHRDYSDRFIGDGFNIFDFIGYNERNLSDVIARLLDPAGGHGQGTVFLSHFLNMAARKAASGDIENIFVQLEQAVRRKESIRLKREHGTSGRRLIDIVIDVGEFRLAVENKPRAVDQDKQVSDYIVHLKQSSRRSWAFVYLTGYGAPPSEGSLCAEQRQELLKSGRYVELDYANDLAQWAQQCALACEADKIRWFFKDFRSYILREFKSTHNEETDNAG
jgi:hypothetical protein